MFGRARRIVFVLAVFAGTFGACSLDRSGQLSLGPGRDGALPPPAPDADVLDMGTDDDGTPVVRDSGPVDPPMDLGPGLECTDGATRCMTDRLERCGSGRWAAGTSCPFGCADGSRCRILVPSHVSPMLLDARAPDLVIDRPTVIDTTMCSGGSVQPQMFPGATNVCVLPAGNVRVEAVTVTVIGRYPLVVLAAGDVLLAAGSAIALSATGAAPGPGGSPSGFGANPGGAGGEVGGSDGGGGGGGLCGAGGRGGDGLDEGALGGLAGLSFGSFPGRLLGGSGGGNGGAATGPLVARGGAGGGALQITAQGTMTLRGRMLAAGGGGEGGARPEVSDTGAGGGGGSGGMIYLEAAVILDEGLYAGTGGGGGGGSASNDGTAGFPGLDGESVGDLRPAPGGASGGGTYSAPGGEGGANNAVQGITGSAGQGNGGGGGGGTGCVAFRTMDGELPPGPGLSSPSAGVGLSAGFVMIR